MTEAADIIANVCSPSDYARSYVARLTEVLNGLDFDAVGKVIDVFLEARQREATIFFLGNGGSAATASHFANDLGFCASPEGRRPFRSLSLTANNAFITCLANDIGYENVFSWQLRNPHEAGRRGCGHLGQRQFPECCQSAGICGTSRWNRRCHRRL